MVFKSEFYAGSKVLMPLAEIIGIPIDQINFLVCQLVALSFAFPFRSIFSVEKVGAKSRHIIEATVGMMLTIFCFGYQIWHLVIQSLVSYVFMAYGGKRFSSALVFGFSMVYLSVCHIYRQVYDYGGYTLDITGPLMIQTQKLTSLAFALHDGRFKDQSQLSADQKYHAVKKLPGILQYLSFMFYFHGVMVGPLTFYNDYIAFIDGTNYIKPGGNAAASGSRKHPSEDLNRVVIKKLLVASACCMGMLILPGLFFPPEKLNTPEYYNMTFFKRLLFILGVMTLAKHKYYFAWVLGDAVNNAAGLGFSGYDAQGNPEWDMTDNVDVWGVEFSLSLKSNIDSWNKKTLIWLRRVVYDRSPVHPTLAVFACSAFWHGFYPAYYVTFMSAAFMTVVARQARRKIRPHFQGTPTLRLVYDVITFIACRLANAYLCLPFLLLEFSTCWVMFKSLYFYLHILAALLLVILKFVPGPKRPQSKVENTQPSTQTAPSSPTPNESLAETIAANIDEAIPSGVDALNAMSDRDGSTLVKRVGGNVDEANGTITNGSGAIPGLADVASALDGTGGNERGGPLLNGETEGGGTQNIVPKILHTKGE